MERDYSPNELSSFTFHFNSHAHVERDLGLLKLFSQFFISTHTLTWRVTHFLRNFLTKLKISTHTLTWSVTHTSVDHLPYLPISTHTLTWSVTHANPCALHFFIISTHTLTWSVTALCLGGGDL